ncbi:hydroxyacylglutathione hydrolase [Pseudogulbenkiania subflava]|uniref:Hydroxyacylglutathione hydrolase n=1 Tax=Pseudogulbenkiania subflava DSM 22618 TaxID=1123014 RepID=A0A1Y6BP63_9NEIS|nr:hydroxyacylglutathione hydrolase [Pseudogulbenkiania subflava]SMF13657.1 hydroxyacylglutathione hydrolase [Pseudogulbenkiania subflava DSM 22618]
MFTVTPVPAFSDNYIWLLQQAGRAVAVDPGDAAPVLAHLAAHGLTLEAVLVTHHHADHVGGLAELARHTPRLRIIGPASIAQVNEAVMDGSRFELLGAQFDVLEVPGHTLDHLAYLTDDRLFCGDTLFGAGCGRLFEGSPEQMHASLGRIAALPDNTRLYPAHEYTLSNLRFAAAVEPDNDAIRQRLAEDQATLAAGEPTLPSTLGKERATNPFLRTEVDTVTLRAAQQAGTPLTTPVAVFAVLREWKNSFR